MKNMEDVLADRIAMESLKLYHNLPKKGKPVKDTEWTLLSSLVMSLDGELSVVAMATGTKCLGQNELSPKGDLINDSHAEVLCRRCFLRYLFDQILKFKNTGSSEIIDGLDETNRYKINSNAEFHFFTSHVPCGDASIIPKTTCGGKRAYKCDEERIAKRQKVNLNVEHNDVSNQNSTNTGEEYAGDLQVDDTDWGKDIHRTGAKCVGGDDPKLAGAGYHTVGAVRTKPGRGDPTLSVSCSDKMARWVACGLQGALLSLLLSRPVLLRSIVVGGGGPFSLNVLERAVVTRTATSHRPVLTQSSVVFPQSRYHLGNDAKPCPSAVLWAKVNHKPLEVCVEGRRQGATRKCRDNGRLLVCRLELLRNFVAITGDRYRGMKYSEIKATALEYKNTWFQAKEKLGAWTEKPENLQHFTLD